MPDPKVNLIVTQLIDSVRSAKGKFSMFRNRSGLNLLFVLLAPVVVASCGEAPPVTGSPTAQPSLMAPTVSPLPTRPIQTTPSMPTQSPVPSPEATVSGPQVIQSENASQMVPLTRLGKGAILSTPLYSPDGKWMAIPTAAGIYIYDAITLEERHILPVNGFITFSPDSRSLAASGFGGVSLWDPVTGDRIGELQSSPEIYHWELSFSPDGSLLAAVTWENEVVVWSLASGERLFTFPGHKLEFSPDGELVVVVIYGEDQVHLYETRNGTEVNNWNTWHAGFAPGGQLWLEDHESVRLAYLDRNQVTAPFRGNKPVFSADGTLMALFAHQQISLYDHQKGRRAQMLDGNFEQINELQFSPDGQTVAGSVDMLNCPTCLGTDGWEPYLVLWRVADGAIITQMEFPSAMLAFSVDGSLVVAAQLESVQFIKTSDSSITRQLEGFSAPVLGMALVPEGEILTAVYDTYPYTLRFWDLAGRQVIRTLQGRDYIHSLINNVTVAFSPKGEYLAVGGDLWDLTAGERMTVTEQAITAATSCLSTGVGFSPIGEFLATGCFDGQLDLWRIPDGELIKRFGDYSGWVYELAYSPDGNDLAALYGIPDDLVQVWQLPDGKPMTTLTGTNFTRVVYSADGTMLATVAANQEYYQYGHPAGFVQLWRATDGRELLRLKVEDAVSIAFSPDGQMIATGSFDGALRLWDTATGNLLFEGREHFQQIQRLVFIPDGTRLISGSQDGTILVWNIPDSALP